MSCKENKSIAKHNYSRRPVILVTDDVQTQPKSPSDSQAPIDATLITSSSQQQQLSEQKKADICYTELAAVTKPETKHQKADKQENNSIFDKARRKSSVFVSNLLGGLNVPATNTKSLMRVKDPSKAHRDNDDNDETDSSTTKPISRRRLSIYEMTKTPPPETSIEMYLGDRRRSSSVSAKQVQQIAEQQSTFEANYAQRQKYFKDLNEKLLNRDSKLLNVVANRGAIHRHSVDIAQLPLAKASAITSTSMCSTKFKSSYKVRSISMRNKKQQALVVCPKITLGDQDDNMIDCSAPYANNNNSNELKDNDLEKKNNNDHHNESVPWLLEEEDIDVDVDNDNDNDNDTINNNNTLALRGHLAPSFDVANSSNETSRTLRRLSMSSKAQAATQRQVFVAPYDKQNSSPAPSVATGMRIEYNEYYGSEFGTIRWIGRVPQISADWTVGVEFDNAIGEGDGSLNGRRYFIAKDCFAKFLPLCEVKVVDEHIGRPEPGTMISVMSAAVQPGQMISIQRVSTVHVQHCFLNAPHRRPGDYLLAVNTRLHCQCPNCGPCAHVIMPPRVQRLAPGKNATHMCQFSHYSCCQTETSAPSSVCNFGRFEQATNNHQTTLDSKPFACDDYKYTPPANSWIAGSGYLSSLREQQAKLVPHDYFLGLGPHDKPPSLSSKFHSKHSPQSHKHRQDDNHNQVSLSTSSLKDKEELESSISTLINQNSFATNNSIDSKLERDLEILSEARYGHSSNKTSKTNIKKQNSSSTKLSQTLKSLVSCINPTTNSSSSNIASSVSLSQLSSSSSSPSPLSDFSCASVKTLTTTTSNNLINSSNTLTGSNQTYSDVKKNINCELCVKAQDQNVLVQNININNNSQVIQKLEQINKILEDSCDECLGSSDSFTSSDNNSLSLLINTNDTNNFDQLQQKHSPTIATTDELLRNNLFKQWTALTKQLIEIDIKNMNKDTSSTNMPTIITNNDIVPAIVSVATS